MDRYVFNPFSILLLLLLFLLLIVLIPIFIFGFIGGALTNLGFTWQQALLILAITLIGSFINLPVKTQENRRVVITRQDTMFGYFYRIPEVSTKTLIAVNVGGALVPTLISCYLIYYLFGIPGETGGVIAALAAVVIVTLVTHRVARPVPGLGIATPILIPPLCALICGLLLPAFFISGSTGMIVAARPVVAYVGGTLGTLIGADLLNLNRIGELGAPVASIGGAGTFDRIFLTGIIAAFLL
jgi:uncharacterized membrane protein